MPVVVAALDAIRRGTGWTEERLGAELDIVDNELRLVKDPARSTEQISARFVPEPPRTIYLYDGPTPSRTSPNRSQPCSPVRHISRGSMATLSRRDGSP